MATVRLLPIPQTDTLYVSEIGANEEPSKNDVEVRALFDANVTGLSLAAFNLTAADADGNEHLGDGIRCSGIP